MQDEKNVSCVLFVLTYRHFKIAIGHYYAVLSTEYSIILLATL